jgi:hypothetical protein
VSQSQTKSSDAMHPARWALTLVALAIVAALTAPIGALASQTPSAEPSDGIVSVVPDSALMFAQINLDPESSQMVLARQLLDRAGLGDPFEDIASESGFPQDAVIGVVVTSIPATDDLDIADVSVDPSAATDALDEGGFAAIVRSADPQMVYDAQIDEIQADAGSTQLTETDYSGVTITSFEPADDDEYTDPSAVAIVGDYVVAAMRADDIHPIIDTFNGDTPNLSTSENYQAVNALLPAESISNGYVDGPAILEAAQVSAPETLELADPRLIALSNSWSGYALAAEQDGFRMETRSIAAGDRFDDLTPLDGSFFDKVPSDALFAVNGTNIDANGALTMLAFVFAAEFIGDDIMATPTADLDLAATQEQVFARAEQMLGFNLKTDLIDHLIGEFGISVSVSDITSPTPSVSALIVTTVDDPQAVVSTIAKVSLIVGAALGDQTAVGERDVAGSTVNVIDISDTGVADKVDFGIVGDELILGVGTGLDDYVDGPENPMSEDPNFTAVMEHLPSEYGSLTYVNMPVVLELLLGISESLTMDMTDADPSCGEYASQEEAQAAYDEDQFENYELDQDFDGEACEDYFGATAAATPSAAANPYQNVLGMGTVTTLEDGIYGTTTFLLIGGE